MTGGSWRLAVGDWRESQSDRHRQPRAKRTASRQLLFIALALLLASACATTQRRGKADELQLRGVASWYGEEFAGRTTANGEIFDPLQLTAAHRTLPFGTVLDVTNRKTGQSVRVRINDRGPYIENRLIDLSWAAAKEIGMVEEGVGEVELAVVRMGEGEREPPVPFDVTVGESKPATAPAAIPESVPVIAPATPAAVPDVAPLPAGREEPVVVDRVEVQEQRAGVPTRRRVAADGKTLEVVPVPGGTPTPSAPRTSSPPRAASPASSPARPAIGSGFVVQAGAFAAIENAKLLQERLLAIGMAAWIDSGDLHRVRIGPFRTREEAIAARDRLEARGMSAMVVRE